MVFLFFDLKIVFNNNVSDGLRDGCAYEVISKAEIMNYSCYHFHGYDGRLLFCKSNIIFKKVMEIDLEKEKDERKPEEFQ